VVKRLLYWFSCKIDGIPELNRLPYAERARITGAARQAMFWAEMTDRRELFWFLLFFHACFVGIFVYAFFASLRGLVVLVVAAIAVGWVFHDRVRYTKMFHDHVRRIVAEKGPAARS
jgi:hypothetical protein